MARFQLRLTIGIAPVSKKNSSEIAYNRRTGKPFLLPSRTYRAYERACGPWLRRQDGYMFRIDRPVNVKCLFYMKTRRKCDLTNMLEAVDDVLVKYGILADDNYTIVAGHDGSRVLYDKDAPRTEVFITSMEEE